MHSISLQIAYYICKRIVVLWPMNRYVLFFMSFILHWSIQYMCRWIFQLLQGNPPPPHNKQNINKGGGGRDIIMWMQFRIKGRGRASASLATKYTTIQQHQVLYVTSMCVIYSAVWSTCKLSCAWWSLGFTVNYYSYTLLSLKLRIWICTCMVLWLMELLQFGWFFSLCLPFR